MCCHEACAETAGVVARSSVRLRRAFDAMDRKRRGFVDPDDLLRYVQRERGIPAACLSHCRTALQRHMGSQRIGCAIALENQKTRHVLPATSHNSFLVGQLEAPAMRHRPLPKQAFAGAAKHDWLVASCRFSAFQRLVRGGALLRGQCGDAAACLVSGTSRAVVRGAASPKSGSAWRQLISGAAAGAASRTATAPLETVRLQAMTGALPAGQPLRSARSVAAASGWKSLCALSPFHMFGLCMHAVSEMGLRSFVFVSRGLHRR